MWDIVSVGEILIDLTQTGVNEQGVGVYAANPGGGCSNMAVAAARLGARTAFVGKVGRDGFGSQLIQVMERSGVDVSGMVTGDKPTTLAIVSVDPTGERDFTFVRGADCDLAAGEVPFDQILDSKFLHCSSVALSTGASREATLMAIQKAHQNGVLVSYDPNYRPPLWENEEAAFFWMSQPLGCVDILKIAEEELPVLTDGITDPEKGTALLAQKGISLVLLTLGSKGVFYRWKDKTGLVPGVKTKVVDTIGAGDTFLGAALSRLAKRPQGPLEGLEAEELEEILAFANKAASITCSRSGGIPAMPTLAEVTAD